jgi:hypothetical protein
MSQLAIALLFLAIGVSALAQAFTDPRVNRAFVAKTLLALLVYAAHIGVAILVIAFMPKGGPNDALGITLAVFGWIGLGFLGLVRFAPRLKEPPQVLLRFGLLDVAFLAMIAGGLLTAWSSALPRT